MTLEGEVESCLRLFGCDRASRCIADVYVPHRRTSGTASDDGAMGICQIIDAQ
ncbi:hypothetical protein [Sphingomonas sp. HMP9]|uniref:hypothetical protein n=1 Tax=Sphingomonas sp. HMP9 TaxID=1517554 RepID=UPI00159701EC|nr:hypothetical protein [Sphingomonas sp. HMP9]